ncbi:Crp/Fnr family transcriptional regulator [Aeribacillus pallidus]|jgi:CRP-like cAMP-binding protein|uniref:Crp/Fnr family transcriptional regulator n=1 Tax=Aeribacillus pallidus TaxID=33936 RepID=UPI001D460DA7|nr:Crp/Fnr family transcriptional regulator [Bacillus sp. (in: firmicutes)]
MYEQVTEKVKQLFHQKNVRRKYAKGKYLFQEGMPVEELFYIHTGKIQISKVIPDGKELSLQICQSGDIIGEFTLFCPSTTYSLNGKMLEDGEVFVLPKTEFEEALAADPSFTLEWLKWIQLQNRRQQSKFRDLILHGKKGALFSTLIRLVNSFGKEVEDGMLIDVKLTNQQVANLCGTSREVINRMLGDLKKNNIVSIKNGHIIVHDLEFLKREIDCENCPIDICRME